MTTQSLPLGILHAAEQQALQQTLSNHPSKCGFQHTNCLQLASTTFTEEFTQIWPNLLKCSPSSDHSMKKTFRREEEYIDAPITNWLTDAKISLSLSLSLSHTHTHTHVCVHSAFHPNHKEDQSKPNIMQGYGISLPYTNSYIWNCHGTAYTLSTCLSDLRYTHSRPWTVISHVSTMHS